MINYFLLCVFNLLTNNNSTLFFKIVLLSLILILKFVTGFEDMEITEHNTGFLKVYFLLLYPYVKECYLKSFYSLQLYLNEIFLPETLIVLRDHHLTSATCFIDATAADSVSRSLRFSLCYCLLSTR